MVPDDNAKIADAPKYTLVCSVFELKSEVGYFVPNLNIRYDERDSSNSNFITGGGMRVYISRIGEHLEQSAAAQAADSHFMIERVIAALLISGAGLFRYDAKGRIFLCAPVETLQWTAQTDLEPYYGERAQAVLASFDEGEFGSWLECICAQTPIRRALHDAVQALRNPVEAFFYIYRGFEWLKVGLGLSWDDIASDVGVTTRQIKDVGQIANDETGVRHASVSGSKLRANTENVGTWIAGLVHAIECARARIDKSYTASEPKRIAEKLRLAVQYVPYR